MPADSGGDAAPEPASFAESAVGAGSGFTGSGFSDSGLAPSDIESLGADEDAAALVAVVPAGALTMGAGCAGPFATGISDPDSSGALPRECESSARLIVYERNGGSPVEDAELRATGAGGVERTGPLSSSGTNTTITATRMIAPVRRSLTGVSKMRPDPLQSSVLGNSTGEWGEYTLSHCRAGPTV